MPMFTSTHPRSRTHRLRLGFGLGLGLGLGLGASACARERADTCAPADHPLEAVVIHLQAGEQLNLDAEGFALPTVVRVVQLSGELGLRDPDFAAVWADPAAALGDEFLAVSELEIYPGTHERLAIEPDPQARYLLTYAGFQHAVGDTWYRVVAVPRDFGEQVCARAAAGADPSERGSACVYLSLARNQIFGGDGTQPGFGATEVGEPCAPPPTQPESPGVGHAQ